MKLLILFYFCFKLIKTEENPIIQITDGKIEGKILVSKEGRNFYAFQSIPYAEPPLGELRFKHPIPKQPWSGVLDGTKPHVKCPQKDFLVNSKFIEGDENCLYLNVYTPNVAENEKLSVMVFIHGGGYFSGSGNYHTYPPEYLLDHDIVLVTLNYRLGPFGFLSTEDEHSPGNYGLKDQNLALKWVQKNIAHFGGNPKSVTIFGESAGGASVHFHRVSSKSKGLFHKGISQSGTAFNTWAIQNTDENKKNNKILAENLNCPIEPTEKFVECLRKIDADTLTDQHEKFFEWHKDPLMPFTPIVEHPHPEAFLTDTPQNLVKDGEFQDSPWILGMNKDEGIIKSIDFILYPHLFKELSDDFNNKSAITNLYHVRAKNPNLMSEKIRKFYWGDIEELNAENSYSPLTKLYSDAYITEGVDEFLLTNFKLTKEPIYNYLFDYKGRTSFSEVFAPHKKVHGVSHLDELLYLFPMGETIFPNRPESDSDKKIRKLLTTLWVNFAKTGNPTPEMNELIKKKWTPVQTEKHEYYLINDEIQEMRSELFKDRVEFWRELKKEHRNGIKKEEL